MEYISQIGQDRLILKYLNEFIDSNLIDSLISKYEIPTNETLASDLNENEDRYILTGAVEALKLVDKSNDDINKYLHVKFCLIFIFDE